MILIEFLNFLSRLLHIAMRLLTASTTRTPSRYRSSDDTLSGVDARYSYTRRLHRRTYRRPLALPSRPCGTFRPEHLVRSILRHGRVPIEYYRHPNRLANSIRRVQLNLLLTRTSPKSAFVVSNWQYSPASSGVPGIRFTNSGSFVLRVQLHHAENRWHFKRSIKAGNSRSLNMKVIAIASAHELVEPTAWVRCLVVNGYTINLPKDTTRCSAVCSADPLLYNDKTVFRSRQKDVPEDAIWLIVPDQRHAQPSSAWGLLPEHYDCDRFRMALQVWQLPAGVDDVSQTAALLTWQLKARCWFWIIIGPGSALVIYFLLLPSTVWGSRDSIDPIVTYMLSFYFLVYIVTAVAYIFYFIRESRLAKRWRKRESQTSKGWMGGTTECFVAGTLLRRGVWPTKQDWNNYWLGN